MSLIDEETLEGAPPLPMLKRLAQRSYTRGERVGLNCALILLISGGEGFLMSRSGPQLTGSQFALANWIGIVGGSVLFLLRRHVPRTTLIGVTALGLAEVVLRLPPVCLFYTGFGLYGVVAASSQRTGVALGAVYLALVIAAAVVGGSTPANAASGVAVGCALVVAVGWLAGENTRASRIYTRFRLEREASEAAAAEAERAERTRRTLADERVTIARELHDIVAHSMSVVAVRSGVARMVIDRRPEEAAEALAIIETTARQSLAEIRMMVSMLRESGGDRSPEHGPLPGLGDLDHLIAQLATAGVAVDLSVEGPARPLAPAADLTAYRIVQEALTNVVRHAAPTTANVRLAFAGDQLEIDVANAGIRTASETGALRGPRGHGHGLVGMRERAAMFGGTLEAGPDDGGFRVHTSLKIDG